MKKLLLLLLFVPLVSCSSDDDANRTTDPFIGTWYLTQTNIGGEYSTRLAIKSNGTFTGVNEYSYEPVSDSDSSGEWSNSGSDFTSFSQIYTLKFNDEDNDIITVIFSEDFNSWASDSGKTWTRR